ncbi:PT domain-containing protein [Streptomyces sp. NPDC046197]|uniref:PT domain-containing protein n=1 Tax=Streptomyces sp. NPDC046197 TaxID=3154337 RepID=UPI0033EA267D
MSDPGAGPPGHGPSPDGHRRTARATIWAAVIGGCATIVAGVLAALVAGVFQTDAGPRTVSVVSSPPSAESSSADAGPGDRTTSSASGPGDGSASPADDPSGEPTDDPTDTPAGSPTDDPGGDPTDSSGLTPQQRELADRIAGGDLSGCRAASPGAYASAAVNCRSATGPARNPLVVSFADAGRMALWLNAEKSRFTVSTLAANCYTAQAYAGPWYNRYGARTGTILCHWDSGRYRMAWSYDDKLVAVVAEDPNASSLVTWWRGIPVDP